MNKRPQQTEQTKANLKEAFWALFEQLPLDKITVGDVAETAGYNRGTFYLHFEDTRQLLESIEDRLIDDMRQCVETCMQQLEAGEDPQKAMERVLGFYESQKRYLVVLMGRGGDPEFTEKVKELLKPLWRQYVLPGMGRKDVRKDDQKKEHEEPEDFLMEYTLSGALFMISKWLQNPKGVSPERLLHILYHNALGRE